MAAPSVARPRGRPRFSGLAWRRARWGYVFIAPWLIGFVAVHGVPDGRHARLHVHQHQPRPGRTAPLRRPQELRRRCSATSRRGTSLAVTLKFAAAGPAGGGHPAVPRGADAPFAPPARLGRVPRPVLPAVRRPVRGRRPDLARHAQPGHAAGSTASSRRIGIDNPPDWLAGPDLDLPGPGDHGRVGRSGPGSSSTWPASRASRPSSTTPPGSTAPAPGRRCATSRSR